jgi:hypothetical protein
MGMQGGGQHAGPGPVPPPLGGGGGGGGGPANVNWVKPKNKNIKSMYFFRCISNNKYMNYYIKSCQK